MTNRQDFEQAIARIVAQIDADEEQREGHPRNSPLWNSFDDKMVEGYRQLIYNSVAFSRTLAEEISTAFNLRQDPR